MSKQPANRFFGLKEPCANCPFRTDIPQYLTVERKESIVSDLEAGGNFVCHKTVDYLEKEADQSHALACAGARETARRSNVVSQAEQVATRLGLDVPQIRESSPVYSNLYEWSQQEEGSIAE